MEPLGAWSLDSMSVAVCLLICADPDLAFGGKEAKTSLVGLPGFSFEFELELMICGDLWFVEFDRMSSMEIAL